MRHRIGRLDFSADVNLWAVNLPRPSFYFESCHVSVGFTYGNGNSDPVVGFEVSTELSERWADRLDWALPDKRFGRRERKGWFRARPDKLPETNPNPAEGHSPESVFVEVGCPPPEDEK